MTRQNKIDLVRKSEEFEDIMGKPPAWPVRWGSLVVFSGLVLLLFLGWLIKYPDIISSRIVLTTKLPPARLISKVNGRIIKNWVAENQLIERGGKLMLFENTADYNDVFYISMFLDSVRNDLQSFSPPLNLKIPENLKLGDIQSEYLNFIRTYKDFKLYKEQSLNQKEVISTLEQLKYYKDLRKHLTNKLNLYKQELSFAEEEHKRNEKLYSLKVIATKDIELSQQVLLSKKQIREEIEASIIQSNLKISELQNLVQKMKVSDLENEQQLVINLTENYKKFIEAIKRWEQNFLLISPISGRVTFFSKYWSENQFVSVGEEVLTVVPNDSSKIIGKVSTPIVNSGKIKIGQRVNIMLDNYPFEEFGFVQGIVKQISLVPKDNLYSIEVELSTPNLKTTYGKILPFQQEMLGSAEIITEDIRFITRILYSLRKRLLERK